MKVFDENAPWRPRLTEDVLRAAPDDILLGSPENVATTNWPAERLIVIADRAEATDLVGFMNGSGVRHVVQVSNPRFLPAVALAGKMIAEPVAFTNDPIKVIFGGRAEGTESFHVQRYPFDNSTQKREILDAITAYLEALPKARTVREAALAIADELFTNALFHSPAAAKAKKGKFAKLQRNLQVELDPGQSATLTIAHDETTLVVCGEDSHGLISPIDVFQRIKDCYARGVAQVINYGPGGGGMEQSSSYIVAVHPGKKTVVLSCLLLGLPVKTVMAVPKNLGLVVAG